VNEHLRITLDVIKRYKRLHDGCSPTLRWLCGELGVASTSTMTNRLNRLREAGRIRWSPHSRARSIEIVGGRWTCE